MLGNCSLWLWGWSLREQFLPGSCFSTEVVGLDVGLGYKRNFSPVYLEPIKEGCLILDYTAVSGSCCTAPQPRALARVTTASPQGFSKPSFLKPTHSRARERCRVGVSLSFIPQMVPHNSPHNSLVGSLFAGKSKPRAQ